MDFDLEDIPMSITVNGAYSTLPNGRRCKSPAYARYIKEFDGYVLTKVNEIKALKSNLEGHTSLVLELVFYFPKDKLFYPDGNPKKLDVSNRIKVIEDLLCNALGIDDSLIFDLHAKKRIAEKESISLCIRPLLEEFV